LVLAATGALDARNYFNDDPNPKLTRTLEQFGGSLGGAIVKDKAFFFFAYEGQRYNVGNSYGGVTSPDRWCTWLRERRIAFSRRYRRLR
jgi:hypothetical protein